MKIKAFSTLGEISHFAISGYFVISCFDITGVDCINYLFKYQPMDIKYIFLPVRSQFDPRLGNTALIYEKLLFRISYFELDVPYTGCLERPNID